MRKLFLFCTLTYTSFFIAQEAQMIKYPWVTSVDQCTSNVYNVSKYIKTFFVNR